MSDPSLRRVCRMIAAGLAPEPAGIWADLPDRRLTVKCQDPTDVDTWAGVIGMHPPRDLTFSVYGAVEFFSVDGHGWCGFTAVYVYCDQWGGAS